MNPRVFFFLILVSASYLIDAQDMHSRWVDVPVQIDGNPQEWPQPFRYYDPESKLQYSVANDSANIYVCLKLTDEAAQLKLFRAGVNVWLDPKGKRKEAVGVSFPMKGERGSDEDGEHHQRQPGDPAYKKPDIGKLKQRMLLSQIILKVTGFNNIPDQVLPLQNNLGINVAFGWDSLDILCIEYKIPIVSSLKHNLTAADTTKQLGLGFIVGIAESPAHSANGSQGEEEDNMHQGGMSNSMNRGGMNNGGMGGRSVGGSGMGGHSGGGNTGFGSTASQEQKIWAKLTLSLK